MRLTAVGWATRLHRVVGRRRRRGRIKIAIQITGYAAKYVWDAAAERRWPDVDLCNGAMFSQRMLFPISSY